MERGKLPSAKTMAKRLAKVLKVNYKVFSLELNQSNFSRVRDKRFPLSKPHLKILR
jgi:hypothetical protein